MQKGRLLPYIVTCLIVLTWGYFAAGMWNRVRQRNVLEFEPRISADGDVILRQEWMGVYLGGEKVGRYLYTLAEGDPERGEAYRAESVINVDFLAMGQPQKISLRSDCSVDNNLVPLEFQSVLASSMRPFMINGRIKDTTLSYRTSMGDYQEDRSLSLARDEIEQLVLPDTLRIRLLKDGLARGKRCEYLLFDPVTQTLAPVHATVEEATQEDAYSINVLFKDYESNFIMTRKGEVLREETQFGGKHFSLVAESEDEVERMPSSPARMNLVLTSRVVPDGELRVPPEQLHSLRLRVKQVPLAKFSRHNAIVDASSEEEYLITLRRGFSGNISEEDLSKFLKPTSSMPTGHKRIVEVVEELNLDRLDRQQKIHRIRDFVHESLKKLPSIGIPNAVEVLSQKSGDCNEHAVLFGALARASGIPCKVVAGLAFLNDAFYYHAWNEVLAEDGWTPVDATFDQWPADATHFKLVEGELSEMIPLLSVVGKAQIEIIGYETIGSGSAPQALSESLRAQRGEQEK